MFWWLMKKINFWLCAGWVASYLQRSLSAQVNGGSRCHPDCWKQPFSAVRASGGYPGNVTLTLQKHHNECYCISNHRCLDCLLNQLFRCISKTKQNSTQSIGNMPPLPPCHLLPHVLQITSFSQRGTIMNKIHKAPPKRPSTQIWPVSLSQNSVKIRKINKLWSLSNWLWRWSGYISMQNVRPFPQWVLQEMTRNPKFDPFHYVKIVPKLEKSTDHDHNLISSESGQDTSACKISGHSLHEFSRKCPESPNLICFTKSK